MSPIVIQIIQFFLSLSLLIVLHELGHFIPAKLFKTRVEKFYLFFDIKFSLFKKKIGGTEYGIGWLPLGGYVKISGMIDESMDKEQMALPPKEWEFRSKPAWQRLIIMLGGVTVNFVLAVLIYIAMAYAFGDKFVRVDSLNDGFLVTNKVIGDKLGIKTGDNIIAIDGEKVERFRDIPMGLVNGNSITLKQDGKIIEKEIPVDFIATLLDVGVKEPFISYRRAFIFGDIAKESINQRLAVDKGDELLTINGNSAIYLDEASIILANNKNKSITLKIKKKDGTVKELSAKVDEDGKLGVSLVGSIDDYEERGFLKSETMTYNFMESIPAGVNKGVETLSNYVKQMKKIFNPSTGAYKGVGGFAAIGSMFPDTWNWPAFWSTTAFISIVLAFMNILPIPALDGGHVMFLLYEIITGRKPSDKFMEYAQMTGFFLLIALLLFANGNDVYKWIQGLMNK